MKKLLLLMCVLTTSLLHAMEQQQCWLAKLPLAVQNQIAGYLNDEWQRGWLLYHMKTHKQGNKDNPVTVWDEVKKKNATISLNRCFSLQMKYRKVGLPIILYKRSWDSFSSRIGFDDFVTKLARDMDHLSECFAVQLLTTCRAAVFWEKDGLAMNFLKVIDLSSDEKESKTYMLTENVECLALSRIKDIAVASEGKLIIFNQDATLKSEIVLPDIPLPDIVLPENAQKRGYVKEAIDFSPDGSMIGIRLRDTIIFLKKGEHCIREGEDVIRVFDIPAQVPDTTFQSYSVQRGVCKKFDAQ